MWILLTIFFFVLLLFFYSRRLYRRKTENNRAPDIEESISEERGYHDQEDDDSLDEEEEFLDKREVATTQSQIYRHLGPDDIVILRVIAPQGHPFHGYELVQTLLSEGLRYGAMNIFHHHEDNKGRGEVLFSVASLAKPGTFDLESIGGLECPGLTYFFSLRDVVNPVTTFELMWESINRLVEELGGKIYNQQHDAMSIAKLSILRAKIKSIVQARERYRPNSSSTTKIEEEA